MDFALTPGSSETAADDAEPSQAEVRSGFVISPTPVVAGRTTGVGDAASELPKPKGNEPLYLLPRDPTSAYAFWNVDWTTAFGETAPTEREVLLKVSKAAQAEGKRIPVQPTAGSCVVEGLEAGSTYRASLGYYDLAGYWVLLATSTGVTTPASISDPANDDDFATVPFHLSFQRMLELLRVSKGESRPLTTMLKELRSQDVVPSDSEPSLEQNELVDALRKAVVQNPPPQGASAVADLWTPELMNQVLGGSKGSASSQSGFGGSSHAA
ncbi:MAG: DUF4912 domain-containing protein [Chthoniobacterales bacterium]